jgi:hypothetical protein
MIFDHPQEAGQQGDRARMTIVTKEFSYSIPVGIGVNSTGIMRTRREYLEDIVE